jgi:hypothetical protein
MIVMTQTLKRITTEYIGTEDRIRLSGEVGNDVPLVIWLTQRLLQRLVPMLLRWLENQNADMPYADILQGFAQQAATAGLTPQAPVLACSKSTAWLAQSVDIGQSKQAVTLRFCGADGEEPVSLTLAATLLRQWLSIVYDAYIKAKWPIEIWPAWLRESVSVVKEQAVMLQ